MSADATGTDASADAECQTEGCQPTIESAPWSSLPSSDRRDRLTRAVADHPEGRCLPALVQDVFGELDHDSGDYRLALRHYDSHSEYFHIRRSPALVWVYPTPKLYNALLDTTASKHTVETQDGDGVAVSNAKSMLRRRRTFGGPAEKGDLVGAFGAKREGTEGTYHVHRDTFGGGDGDNEYLLVPYATRFNSKRRVNEIADRYDGAWDRAADEYDVGVVATLTTDPSRYGSLAEMCDDLLDDVNALKDWLAYSPENGPARAGERPPSVVSVEFTDDGKPHVHVAFFGVGWLADHAALSRYWAESRDRGEVVWIDRIKHRGSRWLWASAPEDRQHGPNRTTRPREYLKESIEIHRESADCTADEVQRAAATLRAAGNNGNTAESGGESDEWDEDGTAEEDLHWRERRRRRRREFRQDRLWHAALYWATELPACTVSPSLKPDNGESDADGSLSTAPDGTPLPGDAPSRWSYAGAARYDALPGYIRQDATVIPREESDDCLGPGPPPPGPSGEES